MVSQDEINQAASAGSPSGSTIRLSIGSMSSVFFTDPVCKMQVAKDTAADKLTYKDKNYYFCNVLCAVKFTRAPHLYVAGQAQTAESVTAMDCGSAASTEDEGASGYTCPMHPEIVTDKQMPCPLCGMALDPLEPKLTSEPDHEYVDMLRRFKLSLAFTVPVAFVGMQDMFGSPLAFLGSQNIDYLLFALATPVVTWLGAPFFVRFAGSIKSRSPNMFTLIGAGVGIAYLYSLAVTFVPGLLCQPGGHHDHTATYFEPAAVITTLALLGQVLELRARQATSSALHALITLTPATAHFIKLDEQDVDIDASKLASGDRLRVKPGESIPADGVVLGGSTTVDESMLTGESMPSNKAEGSTIIGGTINQSGSIIMRVGQVGKNTILSQIIKLVAQAQRSRAPVQQTVDKVAAYFMPLVLLASILSFAYWAFAAPQHDINLALLSAISVLIIACPCALGLATPMSITVAMGRAARLGILIKDAATLEQLSKVDTVVIDKTGTLTRGQLTLAKIISLDAAYGDDKVLQLAASLEQSSEHPLAKAIVSAYKLQAETSQRADLPLLPIADFCNEAGSGVCGTIEGQKIKAGNLLYITGSRADLPSDSNLKQAYNQISESGYTPVVVALQDKAIAVLGLGDTLKPTSTDAVSHLKAQGLDIHLLTGDDQQIARGIAQSAGIATVRANVTPAQKHSYIESLIASGKIVAMVGDGINDAPALARAQVGIAMGTGTNIAMEAAGIVILSGDLHGISTARALSLAMRQNIKQNLTLAFGYNILAIPIAAGLLYPWTGMLLSPMLASLAMALSSVSVIGNALRLNGSNLKAHS